MSLSALAARRVRVTPDKIHVALPLLFMAVLYWLFSLPESCDRFSREGERGSGSRAASPRDVAWPACATVPLTCPAFHTAMSGSQD